MQSVLACLCHVGTTSMYGMVQDVRIPYQEKRMFGFVTFTYQKTVKLILAKGNPHYICDARVLVKPYKEKDKVPNKFRHVNHCLIPLRIFAHILPFVSTSIVFLKNCIKSIDFIKIAESFSKVTLLAT